MALPTASDNQFPKVILEEVADDGSATVTPAADHRALFLGEDGTLKLKDSAGAVTTAGGDVSAHTGDTSDAHDASAISVLDTAANFTGTDVEAVLAELQDNIDAGGGSANAQHFAYPPTLAGDSDHFLSDNTTKWTNQGDAWATRDVVGGSIQRLVVVGASKTAKIRQVLGTPLTGAFDLRTLILPDATFHSGNDVDVWFRGMTSADSRVFGFQMVAVAGPTAFAGGVGDLNFTGNAAVSQTQTSYVLGQPLTLRVTRDGGNLLRFWYGFGERPMSLIQAVDTNRVPVAHSQTGTVEWLEYMLVTPAGANASAQRQMFIDYFQSV